MTWVLFRAGVEEGVRCDPRTRCLALATALRARGSDVRFAVRVAEDEARAAFEAAGFSVVGVPDRGAQTSSDGSADDADARDAEAMLAPLEDDPPRLLVVDDAELSAAWERAARRHVTALAVITAQPNRHRWADVVMDRGETSVFAFASGGADVEAGDADTAEAKRPQLQLGAEAYRLLPEAVNAACRDTRMRTGRIEHVLIDCAAESWTARESRAWTCAALTALSAPQFASITVDVVVHPSLAVDSRITEHVAARTGSAIHVAAECPAACLMRADLAIGGAGNDMFARCAAGVASIVLARTAERIAGARALRDAGAVLDIIEHPTIMSDGEGRAAELLRSAVLDACTSPRRVRHCSLRGTEVVRAGGAARAAEMLMTGGDPAQWRVRAADPADLGVAMHLLDQDEPWCAQAMRTSNPSIVVVESAVGVIAVAAIEARSSHATGKIAFAAPLKHLPEAEALCPVLLHLRERRWFGGPGADDDPAAPSTAPLRITVLSRRDCWMDQGIAQLLAEWMADGHTVCWVHASADIPCGDICFMLGATELVPPEAIARSGRNLVVHESDLPEGRGWSPLSWQILEGREQIVVSLIEATEDADCGDIVLQETLSFGGNELIDDLHAAQTAATQRLCRSFVAAYPHALPTARPQHGTPSVWPRRTPQDSRLDAAHSLEAQFDLLRIADPARYPAFFDLRGHRYRVRLERDRS